MGKLVYSSNKNTSGRRTRKKELNEEHRVKELLSVSLLVFVQTLLILNNLSLKSKSDGCIHAHFKKAENVLLKG